MLESFKQLSTVWTIALNSNPNNFGFMTTRKSSSRLQRWFFASLLVFGSVTGARAQTLTNDLVAYWPLDEVLGNKTPDLVSGYDLTLNNLTTNDLVAGVSSNCFSFSNARQ